MSFTKPELKDELAAYLFDNKLVASYQLSIQYAEEMCKIVDANIMLMLSDDSEIYN